MLVALPLCAAEQAPEKDMTPWMWANFIILAVGLGWLTKKYIGPFLQERTRQLGEGIAEAQKQKAEAERRVAEVDARFAALGTEIARLQTEMRAEQAREIERIRAWNAAEIDRVRDQSTQEIESAAKNARLELRKYAAHLAVDLAGRKIRARMTPQIHEHLAREFVSRLS